MRTGPGDLGITGVLWKIREAGRWELCFWRGCEATGRELVEGRSLIDRGWSGKKCVVLGKKRLSGACPRDAPMLWYCCGSTLSFARDLKPNGKSRLSENSRVDPLPFSSKRKGTKEPDSFSLPQSSHVPISTTKPPKTSKLPQPTLNLSSRKSLQTTTTQRVKLQRKKSQSPPTDRTIPLDSTVRNLN